MIDALVNVKVIEVLGFVSWTEIFNGRPSDTHSIMVVQELKHRDDKDICCSILLQKVVSI